MASRTDIANLALVHLGAPTIMNLDEDSKNARLLKRIFDLVLEQVLRDHPWNCAIRRATLAQLEAVPAFGYSYAYQKPADCLRVLGLVGDTGGNVHPDLEYKLEGDQLLTDESAAQLKYVARVTESGNWDASLAGALAARLAAEAAYAVTGNAELKKAMMVEYDRAKSGAKGVDGQEDTPEVHQNNLWLEARI